ncbi:hypothetical protein MMC31_006040 [Peltigera leucophlebia]|nr:hypothetical protein [Peltigera leucophlebia]
MTEWAIGIRESLAQKIALQVTQGLAYLHSEGICDGNLANCDVLFQLSNFDAWFQEKVYEQLGIPMVLVHDERASPGFLAENIRIIDYGDSFRVGWPNNLSIDQGNLVSGFNPPENLRGLKAARFLDLWALGCSIFEIRPGSHLFPTAIVASPSDAPWEIEDTLGSLPSGLTSPKHDGDGYPDLSGKSKVSDKPAMSGYIN